MREIKFRAWDTVMKDWVPMGVNHISDLVRIKATKKKGEFLIDTFDSGSRRLILMQFTGLKDRNGKEIYEGDILRFFCDGEGFHVGPVQWREEFAVWAVGFGLTEIEPEDVWVKEAEYEVIGNIYENPELLK